MVSIFTNAVVAIPLLDILASPDRIEFPLYVVWYTSCTDEMICTILLNKCKL